MLFQSLLEKKKKRRIRIFKEKVHNKPLEVRVLEAIRGLVGYSKHTKFIKLVPKIQLSCVLWKIQNQYNNNLKSYVKAHPLFVKCFTEEMKHCADGNIEIGERDKKKNKKEFLLYSSQLLGLVGKMEEHTLMTLFLIITKETLKTKSDIQSNFVSLIKMVRLLNLLLQKLNKRENQLNYLI